MAWAAWAARGGATKKCSAVPPLRARAHYMPLTLVYGIESHIYPSSRILNSFNTPRLRARVNLRARVKFLPPQPRQRPWRGPGTQFVGESKTRPTGGPPSPYAH